MRGLNRLAQAAHAVTQSIDAEADAVAQEIEAGLARGRQVMGKFKEFAGEIHAKASEAEAALAQLTNSLPSEVPGGSENSQS